MSQAFFNDVFGRLEWDDPLGCWVGAVELFPGREVEVALWNDPGDLLGGLRVAREGLDWVRSNEDYARGRAAREMVEEYNDYWREVGTKRLTALDLGHRLRLARVGFAEDGSLVLTYDGQDLFGGRLLDGEFDPDRNFRGTYLVE
jgi:hypothetical protein